MELKSAPKWPDRQVLVVQKVTSWSPRISCLLGALVARTQLVELSLPACFLKRSELAFLGESQPAPMPSIAPQFSAANPAKLFDRIGDIHEMFSVSCWSLNQLVFLMLMHAFFFFSTFWKCGCQERSTSKRHLTFRFNCSSLFALIQLNSHAFLLSFMCLATSTIGKAAAQQPPVTAGLIAHYNAESWTGSRWTDLSGAGNHVTQIGGTAISVARPVGAPAYVYGDSTSWMIFPESVLPASYTFLYVARHNSDRFDKRNRIFQGYNVNAVFGHYWKNRMLLFHESCSPQYLSSENPIPDLDWIPVSIRSDSLRFSGEDVTSNRQNGCTSTARLAINNCSYPCGDYSDFAIQSVLVYDVKLSDNNVQRIEAWLQAKQPTFTPANMQVRFPTIALIVHVTT